MPYAPAEPTDTRPAQRILVVDDDDRAGDMLRRFLQAEGHYVSLVRDGNEAVALLGRGLEFDAIFLDVRMPRLDGVTAYRQMTVRLPMPQVVFMTAFSITPDLEQALRQDGLEYLQKPYTFEGVREALGRIRIKTGRSRVRHNESDW